MEEKPYYLVEDTCSGPPVARDSLASLLEAKNTCHCGRCDVVKHVDGERLR